VQLRFDRAKLNPDETYRDDQGFLRAWGVVSKPGILVYQNEDSTRKEFVPETTLLDEEYLRSLSDQVTTKEHPPEPVDSTNADKYSVGHTNDVVYDDGFQRVAITVTDEQCAREIESGKRDELSVGYKVKAVRKDSLPADLVEEIESEFGTFDLVQAKRRANHVAITEDARADVGFQLDSALVDRLDDTPDNPANLPVAEPTAEWDGDQAKQELQQFYDFNPAEDETPEAYADNFAAYPEIGSEEFNSVTRFWGPFVRVIGGQRKIVPDAVIALQNAIQGARAEPDLPGDTEVSDVRNVVEALWEKVWNAHGEDALPSENTVWNRDDSNQLQQRGDSMAINKSFRKDQEGEQGQNGEGQQLQQFLPEEVEDIPEPSDLALSDLRDTMERLKKIEKAVHAKRKQFKKQVEEMTGLKLSDEEKSGDQEGSETPTEGQQQGQETQGQSSGVTEDAKHGDEEMKRDSVIEVTEGYIAERDKISDVAEEYDVRVDGKKNLEIKKDIAEEYTGDRLDSADPDTVDAHFKAAEKAASSRQTRKAERAASRSVRRDAAFDEDEGFIDEDEAQRRYRKRKVNANTKE